MTPGTDVVKKFRRHVDALSGIYYRLDKGISGGRNANSTTLALESHVRAARALIHEDANTDDAPLCTYLDEHPRLSDKWNALERRFFGLAP